MHTLIASVVLVFHEQVVSRYVQQHSTLTLMRYADNYESHAALCSQ
jgi:hypothetical protein